MPTSERLEHLRLLIETATMRHDWAIGEAERSGTTPALTQFIKESRKECRTLNAKLKALTQPAKTPSRPR